MRPQAAVAIIKRDPLAMARQMYGRLSPQPTTKELEPLLSFVHRHGLRWDDVTGEPSPAKRAYSNDEPLNSSPDDYARAWTDGPNE